jgi:chemotaxis signal transduction protein
MTDNAIANDNYIVFTVANTAYALRSTEVQHVEMVEQVTRVPNAAPFVDGVMFSRGQVIPVVNLRKRFGFEASPYDVRTRLIVVQANGRQVGLIADDAREFLRLSAADIQPPQESLAGLSSRYVHGIVSVKDRLILVLQLDQLMNFAEPLIAA